MGVGLELILTKLLFCIFYMIKCKDNIQKGLLPLFEKIEIIVNFDSL
jgi:hypothetical protein